MSSTEKIRFGMHILMFILGVVLAYDYLLQPASTGYLLAALLFLGYSSFRLIRSRGQKKLT